MDPRTKALLEKLAQIESSGGKNIDHKMLTSGIHKGHRAAGLYGLLPNTVADVYSRNPEAFPELKKILKMDEKHAVQNPEEVTQYLNQNREMQDRVAESLIGHLRNRMGEDDERIAYAWNRGHNLKPQDITPGKLTSSDYVQKFRKLSGDQSKPYMPPAQIGEIEVPTQRGPEIASQDRESVLQNLLKYLEEDDTQQE